MHTSAHITTDLNNTARTATILLQSIIRAEKTQVQRQERGGSVVVAIFINCTFAVEAL